MIPWSFSRLNDFETCPKSFHEKHILKSVKFDNTSPHLIKGRDIHEKMERAVKQVIETGGGGFPKEIHSTVPFIQNMVRFARDTSDEPLFLTEQQRAMRENLSETSWFGKDVWVRVIWDWLIIADDKAIVIDWKTGKPWPDQGQLKLFAGAAMAAYPQVESVRTAYVYTEHKKVTRESYEREEYNQIWDEFGERSELIQLANESGNWPAKPSTMGCRWCKVKCEHAGRG